MDWLREQGHDVADPSQDKLTPDEEAAYGAWNKSALECAPCQADLGSGAGKAFPLLLHNNAGYRALAGLECLPTACNDVLFTSSEPQVACV